MGTRKKTQISKAKDFLTRLDTLIKALPTEAEKKEARGKFAALAGFLNELKDSLELLPSRENMQEASKAVAWATDLIARAEANPAMAAVFRARRSPSRKRKGVAISEADIQKAKSEVASLRELSGEAIRSRLQDEERYPLARLRAIASETGLKVPAKTAREPLVEQIATRIVNYRGYQMLSGKETTENADADA